MPAARRRSQGSAPCFAAPLPPSSATPARRISQPPSRPRSSRSSPPPSSQSGGAPGPCRMSSSTNRRRAPPVVRGAVPSRCSSASTASASARSFEPPSGSPRRRVARPSRPEVARENRHGVRACEPPVSSGGVDAGGQNVHVASLAAALAELGVDVDVYTRRDDPSLPGTVAMAPRVDVHHVAAGPARSSPRTTWSPTCRRSPRASREPGASARPTWCTRTSGCRASRARCRTEERVGAADVPRARLRQAAPPA